MFGVTIGAPAWVGTYIAIRFDIVGTSLGVVFALEDGVIAGTKRANKRKGETVGNCVILSLTFATHQGWFCFV